MEWEGVLNRIWPVVAGAEVTLSPEVEMGQGMAKVPAGLFESLPERREGPDWRGRASDQSPAVPGGSVQQSFKEEGIS